MDSCLSPDDSASFSKAVQDERFTRDISQKKRSQTKSLSGAPEYIKMFLLNELELDVELPKKAAKFDEKVTPSRRRKTKDRTIRIRTGYKNTAETAQRSSLVFVKR